MKSIIKIHLTPLTSFFNETELLKLPHYRIRQTIAQSLRLDQKTSRKPKKNPQKISAYAIFKKLKIFYFGLVRKFDSGRKSKSPKSPQSSSRKNGFCTNYVGGNVFENFSQGLPTKARRLSYFGTVRAPEVYYHSETKHVYLTFPRLFSLKKP